MEVDANPSSGCIFVQINDRTAWGYLWLKAAVTIKEYARHIEDVTQCCTVWLLKFW